MKIIRFILSHGLLLGLLVALGFAYYYRSQLFPDSVNQHIDNGVNSVVAASKRVAEVFGYQREDSVTLDTTESIETTVTEQGNTEQASDSVVTEDTASSSTSEVAVEETMPEPPTDESQTSSDVAIQADDAVTDSTDTQNSIDGTDSIQTPQEEMPVPEERVAQADAETVKTETTSITEQNTNDADVDNGEQVMVETAVPLINQARLAYLQGDIENSISLYQQLGEQSPDNPDAFGELGNVYYSLGKWKQAGAAYYTAASLLLEQGNNQQVNYLYRVIQGLDQESADKLKQKLTQ